MVTYKTEYIGIIIPEGSTKEFYVPLLSTTLIEESQVLSHTEGDLVPLGDSLFSSICLRENHQQIEEKLFWVQISSTKRLSSHLKEV